MLIILGSSVLGVGAASTTSPVTAQLRIHPFQGGQQNDSHINATQLPIGTEQPIPVSTGPEAILRRAREHQLAAKSHRALLHDDTEEVPVRAEEVSGAETQRNLGNLENRLIQAKSYLKDADMDLDDCLSLWQNADTKQGEVLCKGIIQDIQTRWVAMTEPVANAYYSLRQICYSDETPPSPSRDVTAFSSSTLQ